MQTVTDAQIQKHNLVIENATAHVALKYFAQSSEAFEPSVFIALIAQSAAFPSISVRELLAAAASAGAEASARYANLNELTLIPLPFLTYLEQPDDPLRRVNLVHVIRAGRKSVSLSTSDGRSVTMTKGALQPLWSGVIIEVASVQSGVSPCSELADFRDRVEMLDGFASKAECAELISYCERIGFRRSMIAQASTATVENIVSRRNRSSCSAILADRHEPLLSKLYDKTASLERIDTKAIELIQCVRYKRGQQFVPHIDAGVHLPRRTTYLLYLNDNFDGGETYFPLLGHTVTPKAGSCLRFPSSDAEGRLLWQSEHGGLPVTGGTKYALNIWVQC